MGKVVDITTRAQAHPQGLLHPNSYSIGVDMADGPEWTVIAEKDLDSGGWTWKAFTTLGTVEAADPVKLICTLQQDPAIIYDDPQEAVDQAALVITEYVQLSKVDS